ncbi:MAG TPA: CopG family transcriptional regulator [Chloroflexota bacterium]|nr:CopG family transcriptional regulator [Chloroflexota bacterium]
MIRTQIQLTEEQAQALRDLAARRGVSLAELVRQGVERILAESERREKRQRALAVLGRFDAGPSDVATNHDRYLAEDYL